MPTSYDIFISYKRKSIHMANNLYYRLTMKGYRVFFDLDEMKNDRFDEQIYNHIRNAKDVIVILEEESLKSVTNNTYKEDWFCKELMFAIAEKKNIIPLLLDNFQMPSEDWFPDELKEFAYKNALPFGGLNYFDDYIHQLETKGYITATPIDSGKGRSVFLFFSPEDCKVYENGKQIGDVKGHSDEPFYYFVNRKGKYRFKTINNVTLVDKIYTVAIDADAQEIVDIEWPERELVLPENKQDLIEPKNTFPQDDVVKIEIGNFNFNMIRVEGGTLEIGATDEQSDFADPNEYPSHDVTLASYYISEFPVTQNLYEIVMGYNKSHFTDEYQNISTLGITAAIATAGVLMPTAGAIIGGLSSLAAGWYGHKVKQNGTYSCKHHNPVDSVSLNDAKEFCRRLSSMTNMHFSLPTEEEWEYAARGGQKSSGFLYSGSNDLNEVAWFNENGEHKTHPVGLKQPNELGLFDMSGNVWEWTETKGHSYATGDKEIEGEYYVRRGGSWWHEAKNCRVSKRYISDAKKKTSGLGFRIVLRNEQE